MNEIVGKFISRNKGTSYFLYATGAILTGILCWGFILSIQAGLSAKEAIMAMPSQLEVMWGTIIGLIAGGHEEEINKAEKLLNKDLDGDGDIGVGNAVTTATPAAAIQASPAITEAVQDGPVAQETVAAVENGRSNNSPG